MSQPIRILGLDPGLRCTGWGVVEISGNHLAFVASGSARSNAAAPLAERLSALYRQLRQIVAEHAPHQAAVEQTFVNRDGSATLKLGQARGIALLAPAEAGIPVSEYAPNAVKKTVIGVGHGDKAQIRMMVSILLPKATFDSDDAADALAIAIAHAHHLQNPAARLAAAAGAR